MKKTWTCVRPVPGMLVRVFHNSFVQNTVGGARRGTVPPGLFVVVGVQSWSDPRPYVTMMDPVFNVWVFNHAGLYKIRHIREVHAV